MLNFASLLAPALLIASVATASSTQDVSVGASAHFRPAFAQAPRHIRKFDIICWVSGHTYRARHPERDGYAGYNMPKSWAYDFRHQINLNRGTYREVSPGKGEAMKIASTTRRIITFIKNNDEHATLDLNTLRHRVTRTLSSTEDGFAAGPCRFARYSGAVQGPLSRRARHPG